MWTPPPLFEVDDEWSPRTRTCSFTRLALVCLLVALVVLTPVVIFVFIGTEQVARAFVAAVPASPSFANALAFFAVNSAIIVLCLPVWVLGSMVVGFTFGFWAGFAINYCTVIFASFTCFTIGRYVFLDTIREYLFKQRQTRVMTRIIELNDFKFLVLFRFLPLPLAVKNYLPACIKVSPLTFLGSVCISAAIFTPIYTFVGATAKRLASLYAEQDQAAGEGPGLLHEVSGPQILVVAVALLAFVAVMVLAVVEWRKVKEYAEDESLATPRTDPLTNTQSSVDRSTKSVDRTAGSIA
jgi:uncharacterized membrane protein YdjX (TVP38/TMEM64 family)